MENEVRNFYDVESQYENLVLQAKNLVEKVIIVDIEKLRKKISKNDTENIFEEYIELLEAVIGKETNYFYYCKNLEDEKYYNLQYGCVYGRKNLNPEIKTRIEKPSKLEMPARIILASFLYDLTLKLKKSFASNLQTGDGDISSIDENIIVKKDIEYLDTLTKYLDVFLDEKGRLRIVAAEQDVFALNKAK